MARVIGMCAMRAMRGRFSLPSLLSACHMMIMHGRLIVRGVQILWLNGDLLVYRRVRHVSVIDGHSLWRCVVILVR